MTPYLHRRALYPPLIQLPPPDNLAMVIVIPAREEDLLLRALQSLFKCDRPPAPVEVIAVVNGAQNDPPEVKEHNLRISHEVLAWARKVNEEKFQIHVLNFPELPSKHAGVGLARKIGMDEACRRLEEAGRPEGIIGAFDADSRCDAGYLTELYEHFRKKPDTKACSIYFEHPLEGTDYPEEIYRAITQYELHLRYFISAQRYAGFPFAYQTIGSSMAVRCSAYQEQGGMNRRKAGEDFYFLHKFSALGQLSELTSTRVIPSPRPSHRVPFGTGRAVQEILQSEGAYPTYAPAGFRDLKELPVVVPGLFNRRDAEWPAFTEQIPESLRQFFKEINGKEKIEEIRQHTGSRQTFTKRFYQWFNAFQVMKFAHFARDRYYPDVPVEEGARWLLKEMNQEVEDGASAKELLRRFRRLDRGGSSGV